MKIYLIGFMGCSKTIYGKALANILNYSFLDLDEVITTISKASIEDLFSESENMFRTIETNAFISTISLDNCVIATGVGTPCFNKNMEWMNNNGITVYLKLTSTRLQERLTIQKKGRPLLKGLQSNELLDYIQNTLELRTPFHNRAHIIVDPIEISVQLLNNIITNFHLANFKINSL